jgi:hypothetical protein
MTEKDTITAEDTSLSSTSIAADEALPESGTEKSSEWTYVAAQKVLKSELTIPLGFRPSCV